MEAKMPHRTGYKGGTISFAGIGNQKLGQKMTSVKERAWLTVFTLTGPSSNLEADQIDILP